MTNVEGCSGVWGCAPQWGPVAKPVVRGQGAKPPEVNILLIQS